MNLLQVEQGFGLGSGMPIFNRSTGSATRFIKLRDVAEGSRSPPLTLVLHARGGTALGDMASYDYFTLGGPFSVRAYTDSCLWPSITSSSGDDPMGKPMFFEPLCTVSIQESTLS